MLAMVTKDEARPLEYVSTDDLIDELLDRHDDAIVMTSEDTLQGDQCGYRRHYSGDHHRCVGMCMNLSRWILAKMEDGNEEFPDG
jgi:hypothetical protein